MSDADPPEAVEDTIQHLAELHQDHHRSAPLIQRLANRTTSILGHPGSVTAIVLLAALWVVGNNLASRFGVPAIEAFPFPDLEFVATIAALFVALVILTTQRHDDELAAKRAQLTLQIAILNEKKVAKVIELLEEQRRDNPFLPSRTDSEANEMARATDPRSTLGRIEETHQSQQ